MKLFYVIAALLSVTSAQIQTCIVQPSGNASIDDAPAIIDAFNTCGKNGKVVFLNETYHINSVMNTTGLKNCEVDLQGTLLWSTNTTYWLANSLPVGYQNQSSAWFFGGDNVDFHGHGFGTLNGNGQVWYALAAGISNFPRRPHAITISETTNSRFTGLRFIQSQMWTMAVIHSKNVLLEDIYVNNLEDNGSGTHNTDGANTIFAENIVFNRWEILNGDDSISVKANSTNIIITNSIFRKGLGLAYGSIGQLLGQFETIQDVFVDNITLFQTLHAAYVKTWTGQQVGFPPNGGGGGLGFLTNVTMSNFVLNGVTSQPFSITQCTTFSGVAGNCDSSLFLIENLTMENATGTFAANPVANLQCSADAPCQNIGLVNFNLTQTSTGTAGTEYTCHAVASEVGFTCS